MKDYARRSRRATVFIRILKNRISTALYLKLNQTGNFYLLLLVSVSWNVPIRSVLKGIRPHVSQKAATAQKCGSFNLFGFPMPEIYNTVYGKFSFSLKLKCACMCASVFM